MKKLRSSIYKALTGNKQGEYLVQKSRNVFFPGSQKYWERRYQQNGNSGSGSYGENAVYKAFVVNEFVKKNNIQKIMELGCGDGNQLKHFQFPEYVGLDVSPTAIKLCRKIFKGDSSKQFFLFDGKVLDENNPAFQARLSLSLDVVYHLVEDDVFEKYMHSLFSIASQFVIIYAWDGEGEMKSHVRPRHFSKWIDENIITYRLKEKIVKPPYCDFFIYEKTKQEEESVLPPC